jgi:hypothetical protein
VYTHNVSYQPKVEQWTKGQEYIGGFLASLVGIGTGGFIGTIIIAFIGACILIAILRATTGTRGRRSRL